MNVKKTPAFPEKWKGPLLAVVLLAGLSGFVLSVIKGLDKPVTPRTKTVHAITVLPQATERREPISPKVSAPAPTPAIPREPIPQHTPRKTESTENHPTQKNPAIRGDDKPVLGTSAPFGKDGFGVGPGDPNGLGLDGGGGHVLAGTHRAGYLGYGQHLQGILTKKIQELEKAIDIQNTLTLVIHIWVGAEGGISRVELMTSSGDKTLDSRLASVIKSLDGQIKPPPQGLPQPIKIRIRS
jgi:periplasmic protein TonB